MGNAESSSLEAFVLLARAGGDFVSARLYHEERGTISESDGRERNKQSTGNGLSSESFGKSIQESSSVKDREQ